MKKRDFFSILVFTFLRKCGRIYSMSNTTTTTTANEKFLQDQVRWVLPEIKDVLKMADLMDTAEDKAEFLQDSMNAVYKRLFKVLEATGTKPSVFS